MIVRLVSNVIDILVEYFRFLVFDRCACKFSQIHNGQKDEWKQTTGVKGNFILDSYWL